MSVAILQLPLISDERLVRELRQKTDDLEPDLKLLKPKPVSDDRLNALLIGQRDPLHDEFRAAMPFVGIEFKQAAYDEIFTCAKSLDYIVNKLTERRGAINKAQAYSNAFQADMGLFHKTWWNNILVGHEYEIGFFQNELSGWLHEDLSPFAAAVGYLARVGALGTEIISGKQRQLLTPEEQNLVKAAMKEEFGRMARQELRDRKILEPLPLGDVAMLLVVPDGEYGKGTLHCSSPVAKTGEHSAFFYAGGEIGLGLGN